jgi:hypothetical protein
MAGLFAGTPDSLLGSAICRSQPIPRLARVRAYQAREGEPTGLSCAPAGKMVDIFDPRQPPDGNGRTPA